MIPIKIEDDEENKKEVLVRRHSPKLKFEL